MTSSRLFWLALPLAATLMMSVAQAATLTTGEGDGRVTVDVTDFGSMFLIDVIDDSGETFSLLNGSFDPVGPLERAGTVFESFVAVPFEYFADGEFFSGRQRLDDLGVEVSVVSQSDTQYVTQFFTDWYSVLLTQTLVDSVVDGAVVGAALIQQFSITSISDLPDAFDIVRYLDGDLLFDDTLDDVAGQISVGSNTILFETDASGGAEAASTFLGITTSVAGVTEEVPDRAFQIGEFAGLRQDILAGVDLDNSIAGDEDGDGFTDAPYDVTLAFQDFVAIGAGQTVIYTTTTLFGNAVPPAPGETESTALLPDDITPAGGFVFDLPAEIFEDGETVWIDPVIAVGYTYEVSGAEFASVTAPSLGLVNDPDGYTVLVDGTEFALLPGATLIFDDGVTMFDILGILESLALDPANPAAFATGVSLRDIVSQTIVITQTPMTKDVPDVAPVPLPAGGVLLGAGLLGLLVVRRRRV